MKFKFVPKKSAKVINVIAIIHAFEDYRWRWFNRLIRFFKTIKRSNQNDRVNTTTKKTHIN